MLKKQLYPAFLGLISLLWGLMIMEVAAQEPAWRTYTTDDGLVSNRVQAIAIDPAGQMWVGTNEGVSTFNGQTWHTASSGHGQGTDSVKAIAIDPNGSVWLGTDGGVRVFDGQHWQTYTTTHGLANDSVKAIAVDPAGPIWVGTANGVSVFDGQRWQTYTTIHGLAHNQVQAIAIDQKGDKWFGTANGVSHFDGQSWTTYTTTHGLAHNWVSAITVDKNGILWFGTRGGGVSRFDGQQWKSYTAADGLANNVIYAAALDLNGHPWFGTGSGVSYFDGQDWTSYTRYEGLSSSPVFALAVDQAGLKWLGTNEGLNQFDEQAWRPGLPVTPTLASLPVSPTLSFEWASYSDPLIDDQAGQIYVAGLVGDEIQTMILDLADSRLLARYSPGGKLALDMVNERLYIEWYENRELAVLDTRNNQLLWVIPLPEGESYPSSPSVVIPASGQVLAFQDNVVYLIDPERSAIVDTLALDILNSNGYPAAIQQAQYDPSVGILYLDTITQGCISSIGGDCSTHVIVSYELATRREITRTISDPVGQVFDGYMYYHDFRCPGASCVGWRSLWRDGRPWFRSWNWKDYGGNMVFDPTRQRFYEASENQLRVYDGETMALLMTLPRPIPGDLLRYHPESDSLQFWFENGLYSWPVTKIQPPIPESLTLSAALTTPVEFLAISPAWPADGTFFAAWADPAGIDPGWLSGEQEHFACGYPAPVYLSADKGQHWSRSTGGLAGSCGLSIPLAVSPNYSHDQTLLTGVAGLGIFKSTDGGQLWLPAGAGLSEMTIEEILLSPGFAGDQTAFAKGTYYGDLYRSRDGGQSWQTLARPAPVEAGVWQTLALSQEFDQDQTLLASFYHYERGPFLYRSKDRGDHWEQVGPLPEGVQWLSPAPLLAQWQTLFAGVQLQDQGLLYRSTDGGKQWEVVFETGPAIPQQLVYAPGIEQDRPLFLLAGEQIYSSIDGGSSWQPLELPATIRPTVLAISPTFTQDRLLFLGTTTGQVVSWRAP